MNISDIFTFDIISHHFTSFHHLQRHWRSPVLDPWHCGLLHPTPVPHGASASLKSLSESLSRRDTITINANHCKNHCKNRCKLRTQEAKLAMHPVANSVTRLRILQSSHPGVSKGFHLLWAKWDNCTPSLDLSLFHTRVYKCTQSHSMNWLTKSYKGYKRAFLFRIISIQWFQWLHAELEFGFHCLGQG